MGPEGVFGAGVPDDPARLNSLSETSCLPSNHAPLRPRQMKRPWLLIQAPSFLAEFFGFLWQRYFCMLAYSFLAPIVYRLGHQVFILASRVRLPVGVPCQKLPNPFPNTQSQVVVLQ